MILGDYDIIVVQMETLHYMCMFVFCLRNNPKNYFSKEHCGIKYPYHP